MSIWSRVSPRESLSGCLVAALLALATGCAASTNSQTASMPAARFGSFPGPGEVDGKTVYNPLLGVVEGTGARTFAVPARTGIMIWVGCIGTGMVKLDSPDIQLGVGWRCDKTGHGSAWEINPTHATAGRKVTIHLAAPAKTRWALRIDATSH